MMRQKQTLLDILWCLFLFVYAIMGVAQVPLHGDESTLIFMGRDFYYHVQGDHQKVAVTAWEALDGDAATEQQLRLINGTLPKYLYGMVAYFSGYSLDDINQQWSWGSGWDWNYDNGHVPSDNLLNLARTVSAVLLAISAIALFFVGNVISGRIVGYIASAYYILNPAILVNGRRAMMEGGMLAFTILAVLVALYMLKTKSWWWYVLLGILSGLAVASKHTSVVTIASIFLVSGVYLLVKREKWLLHVSYLFGAGMLSLVVFFALNPAWWNDPAGTVPIVLELRQELLQGQTEFFGGYDNLTEQTIGFLRQSFVVLPMYAETDSDGFYTEQLAQIIAYDSSLLSGVSLGGSVIGGIVLFILVSVGFASLWLSDTIATAHAWLMSGWLLAMIFLTLVLTPLEWQRYYLPIYPIIGILGAIGIQHIIQLSQDALSKSPVNEIE